MKFSEESAYWAGRLLHWGLQVKARPVAEEEYQTLLDRYLDHAEFRHQVQQFAQGLGLIILDADVHGLILSPSGESVFSLPGSEFHATSSLADDRLLDGLVQVAIAATVFPAAADLADVVTVARPPITVEEIEFTLRHLCDQLAEEALHTPDPPATDEAAGLLEAWRVYQSRMAVHDTASQRAAQRSTMRIIERNLERLRELGCFLRETGQAGAFQPTYRYQVQVKQLAATQLYQHVQHMLQAAAEVQQEGD